MGWLARFALAVTVLSLAGGQGLAPVLSGVALAQSDDRSRNSGSDAGSGSRGSEGGGTSRGGGDADNETGGRENSDRSDGGGRGPSGGQDGSGSGGGADGSDPGEGEAASGKGNAGSGQEADGSDVGEGGINPSDGGDDQGSSGVGDDGGAVEGEDAGSEEGGASDGGGRGSDGNAGDDVGAGADGRGETPSGENGPAEEGSGTGGSGSSGDAAEGSSDEAGEDAPDEGLEGSPDPGAGGSSVDGGDGEAGDTSGEDTAGDVEDDGLETPAAPPVSTRVDDPSPAPQEEERSTTVVSGASGTERPGKNGAPEDGPEPETPASADVRVLSGAAPATGTGSGRAPRSLPDILGAVFGGKQRAARAPVVDPPAEPSSAVTPESVQAVIPDATSASRAKAKEPPSAARAPRIELSSGDRAGNYRQYEITALGLTPRARQVVGALGFRVLSERRSSLLGDQIVAKLRTPGSQTATAALRRVRGLLPEVVFDYAHLYRPSGEQVAVRYPTEMIGGPGAGGCRLEMRIGLIDSGVGTHASLAKARVVRKNFLERDATTNVAHGTAIASILVGDLPGAGPLLPGAKLFAANVFAQDESGPRADATAIIAALDWMAEQRVPVVNLSLMGPSNVLLEAAVQAAAEGGQILVAAAGNGGPGGAPAYPAAYPGVIAVAALDARGRPYGRNNRGPYIYVAAPGVDIWGADARGGEAFWTGTSFAAPFVTASLARDIAQHRVSNVNDGRARIAANARDLGAPGRDPIFGHGLLQAGGCGGGAVMSSRD